MMMFAARKFTLTLLAAGLLAAGAAAQDEDLAPAAADPGPAPTAAKILIPVKIPFQGFLTSDAGVPLDGTVSLGFTLFDAASGGNAVWGPETQSVAVSEGLFQANLGEVVALDPADFTADVSLFLGITVDGGAELSPRTPLLSVPFALSAENATNGGGSGLWSTNGTNVWRAGGRVGIGTAGPQAPLDVWGDVYVQNASFEVRNSTGGRAIYNWAGDQARLRIGGNGAGASNGFAIQGGGNTNLLRVTGNGRVGIGTGAENPATTLDVYGAVTIRGGADIVEGFGTHGDEDVEPGTVMVIDADNAGKLAVSDRTYDARVAGVVSGAGGVQPGIKLGQDGHLDGDLPVAMTGRVYVKCTTENGPIRPGDRLTTASLAGHAMKALDRDRADGAVIGKAMSSLESGTGLVLVLVNLQ
ncbi:MAG: hypothetical protein IPK64_02240 [bacterium]|nr:hypothetical protein [bacterium]